MRREDEGVRCDMTVDVNVNVNMNMNMNVDTIRDVYVIARYHTLSKSLPGSLLTFESTMLLY